MLGIPHYYIRPLLLSSSAHHIAEVTQTTMLRPCVKKVINNDN